MQVAKTGIRCMTIAPGIFGTPMIFGMPQEVQDSLAASIPFPARLGRPEDYAKLVHSIITNDMLNGETIRLDGQQRPLSAFAGQSVAAAAGIGNPGRFFRTLE
ncbi:tetraacyldisaccharide-1-P 4'-kinase-like protein, partial [Bordetella hinzii CA90 BAL1384]